MRPAVSNLPTPKAPAAAPTVVPKASPKSALEAALDAAMDVTFDPASEAAPDIAPDVAPEIAVPELPPDCPKCGKLLADPAGLGWCAGCGYCRSLEGEKQLLETKRGPSLGGVVEAGGGAVKSLPLWFWASGLILAIGITLSIFADKRLPIGDNFERALWASLQIAIGVFIIFLAQCGALVSIAPEDPKLTFKDALAPFHLWVLVCKRLPRLKEALWAAVFGLSLIVGSASFIGGFAHWFEYLPKNAVERERERARTNGNTPVVVQE